MKCLVITPAYSHTSQFTSDAVKSSGLPWKVLQGCSDLVRARSVLISQAIELADRVIFLDSDIVPSAEQLRFLSETNLVDNNTCLFGIYKLKDGTLSVNPRNEYKEGIFEINYAGLGIACISSHTLRKVSQDLPKLINGDSHWYPFCLPFIDHDGDYLADDTSLCQRLRDVGTTLLCTTALKVGHEMTGIRRV